MAKTKGMEIDTDDLSEEEDYDLLEEIKPKIELLKMINPFMFTQTRLRHL
eukprot:CAMPEP_0116889064 /NCGR_PEP_ID=MMETSP0463-20121206/24423_1 /TAXON_ID=181622 /ORGANISM="Strombidinopsis sp, Strain SopsisLIS2011" /LENGTH=49 /DNA_ID= /DNA_START= /DNA_END= /DNA_ORIENTATION=